MDLKAWEKRLNQITGRPPSQGTLEFLVDGKEFFPRLFEVVKGAERSVHIRTYIFDNDDFAVKVADLLRERSDEVDVKVLMDGLGTILAAGVTPETMPAGFEPPDSVRGYLLKNSRVRVRQRLNPWFTGDHVKTITVDGETAFTGGMNIGREYRYEWHDIMIQVKGPAASLLEQDFG
jgi:cardiolipin synthase